MESIEVITDNKREILENLSPSTNNLHVFQENVEGHPRGMIYCCEQRLSQIKDIPHNRLQHSMSDCIGPEWASIIISLWGLKIRAWKDLQVGYSEPHAYWSFSPRSGKMEYVTARGITLKLWQIDRYGCINCMIIDPYARTWGETTLDFTKAGWNCLKVLPNLEEFFSIRKSRSRK